MDYYYFGGGDHTNKNKNNNIDILEDSGFSGVLFTYDAWQGDYFTKISRDIDYNKKIKYMVAIRPHVISPQYLTMISQSINSIMKNRLQINIISGWIKDHEKKFGGVIGPVLDNSSNIDRSNNLIEYIKELDNMKKNNPGIHSPDIFVSATNSYVWNAASELNNKIILPYSRYKNKMWHDTGEEIKIGDKDIMLSISPIIRKEKKQLDNLDKKFFTMDSEYFTYDEFIDFINKIESDGIKKIMVHGWPEEENENIIEFVSKLL